MVGTFVLGEVNYRFISIIILLYGHHFWNDLQHTFVIQAQSLSRLDLFFFP